MPPGNALTQAMQSVRTLHKLLESTTAEVAVYLVPHIVLGGSDGTVSRRNTINQVCQSLGVGGHNRRDASRVLAEGWQLLEQRGYICRDPEQAQGDWWFLTRRGEDQFAAHADQDWRTQLLEPVDD